MRWDWAGNHKAMQEFNFRTVQLACGTGCAHLRKDAVSGGALIEDVMANRAQLKPPPCQQPSLTSADDGRGSLGMSLFNWQLSCRLDCFLHFTQLIFLPKGKQELPLGIYGSLDSMARLAASKVFTTCARNTPAKHLLLADSRAHISFQ